jgi:flagellar biosynthesis/type III secretory pathway M-ring protein FliF/YscJ
MIAGLLANVKKFLSKTLGLPENVCLPVVGILIAVIVGFVVYKFFGEKIKSAIGMESYEPEPANNDDEQYEEINEEEPFESDYETDEDDFDMDEAFENIDDDEDFEAIGNMEDEEMQSLGQL